MATWPRGPRPSLIGSPPTTATSGAWRRGWRNDEGEGDRAVAIAILQRGQVTLAKAIRERVGLAEGDEVLVDVNGNGEIVLSPLPRPRSLKELGNILAVDRMAGKGEAQEAVRKQRARRWAEEHGLGPVEGEVLAQGAASQDGVR